MCTFKSSSRMGVRFFMVVGTTVEISIIVPFTKENVRFYFKINILQTVLNYHLWSIQGYNARKVNCSCVFSAYILKTSSLWTEFVNKNRCISFLWPEYFIDFLCERWIPCKASTSILRLHYHPETVNCSTKDA